MGGPGWTKKSCMRITKITKTTMASSRAFVVALINMHRSGMAITSLLIIPRKREGRPLKAAL